MGTHEFGTLNNATSREYILTGALSMCRCAVAVLYSHGSAVFVVGNKYIYTESQHRVDHPLDPLSHEANKHICLVAFASLNRLADVTAGQGAASRRMFLEGT